MTTREQMKRLELLETVDRLHHFEETLEADLEALRPQAEAIAVEMGCTPDLLLADTAAIARRIAEIGERAALVELAAELGITVDEFLADVEQIAS